MTLPDGVREGLGREGVLGRVEACRAVSGGSIHRAVRVDGDTGPVFVKWSESGAVSFGVEARGLCALAAAARDTDDLRIPEVLAWADGAADAPGWLALEWIPMGPVTAEVGARLGRGLAHVHRSLGGAWGWSEDNLIGSLPQANPETDSWDRFWVESRLGPQLHRAARSGSLTPAQADRVEAAIRAVPSLLEAVAHEPPSLLHGDLWAGNAHGGPGGRGVLVDPSTYHGHREVDLAMSELFGGFPARFFDAYHEAWPLEPGYSTARRPLYQLYYLLVHVNLFGSGYVRRTLDAARDVVAAA